MKTLILTLLSVLILFWSCEKTNMPDSSNQNFSFDSISSKSIGVIYSFKFSNDGAIYATTTSGLHKSIDNGDNWITLINDSFNPKDIMITSKGKIMLDFNGYYLYTSDYYGDSWIIDTLVFGEQMDYSAMDENDVIFMSYYNSNYVYYTQSDLREWDSIYFDYSIRSIERVHEDIYVICSNNDKQYHLFAKKRDVQEFAQLTTFSKFPNSFSNSPNEDEIFVITFDEIYSLNINNGQTTKYNAPDTLEGYFSGFSDIIATDNNEIYLYRNVSFPAEFYPSIVYKSEDYGQQWKQLKEPDGEYIYDMKLSPHNQLFISTFSKKIFRSNKIN
jgi:hypothetical protein